MDISIRRLKGIGIRKAALFERLGIATIPDVLQYFLGNMKTEAM